jgi:nicotinamidase-related amidase
MKVLIVVDMQNDFINGALGSAQAQAIVPGVINRINECKRDGYTIFATRDTHYDDYMNSQEGRKLPVPHCIAMTPGWRIKDVIAAELPEDTKIINKITFGYDGWDKYRFDEAGVTEIELLGLCTGICVISNAMLLKAIYPEITIKVNAGCSACVSEASHNTALEAMKLCQIEIV